MLMPIIRDGEGKSWGMSRKEIIKKLINPTSQTSHIQSNPIQSAIPFPVNTGFNPIGTRKKDQIKK